MGGIEVSTEEGAKLRQHANQLKNRYQQKMCRYCGGQIVFQEDQGGKIIPHDLGGEPHWRSCPYSNFTQKKTSRSILKKVVIYFSLNHPDMDVEKELALTENEAKVYHAILERAINEIESSLGSKLGDDQKAEFDQKKADLPFQPIPTDPVGDPDEDRAPDEDLVKKIQKVGSVEASVGAMVKDEDSKKPDKEAPLENTPEEE